MKTTLVTTAALSLLMGSILIAQGNSDQRGEKHLRITVSAFNITTGQEIRRGETVVAGDMFEVTVTSNAVDCAGHVVVTALGAESLPSVLVQFSAIIIGPASGSDSFTGGVLRANGFGVGEANDWKVSASCNGANRRQFAFDSFEFFAQ